MSYWVYMLECRDGSYYTGIAKDVAKRLSAHEKGKGSRCVASRLPFRLVYVQSLETRSDALKREIAIKKMSRMQKSLLVNGHVPQSGQ